MAELLGDLVEELGGQRRQRRAFSIGIERLPNKMSDVVEGTPVSLLTQVSFAIWMGFALAMSEALSKLFDF